MYTIYSGIVRARPRSLPLPPFLCLSPWTGNLIFVEQTRFLFYQLKRALFFMRTQPMASTATAARRADHTRLASLAVRRKQKSKLGRSLVHVNPARACSPMEFNICCLRYETHGRAFFTFFPFAASSLSLAHLLLFTSPPFPPAHVVHSSRSFLNAIEVYRPERHDLRVKCPIERSEFERKKMRG